MSLKRRVRRHTSFAALLVLALAAAVGDAAASAISGPAEVVDGDGLRIGAVAIRLHGVDAPEINQTCAGQGGGAWRCDEAAVDRLTELVAGAQVECEALDRDRYGRVVARCRAGGVDLEALLVQEGLVWAFTRYSADYVALDRDMGLIGIRSPR